jgi:hypothetical protein
VDEASKTISLWFEMRLNRALLENIETGVVVVDERNRIERINRPASQMLGEKADDLLTAMDQRRWPARSALEGRTLKEFGADEECRLFFDGSQVASRSVLLRGMDGVERRVVASSLDADDAFNRRIWRLINPREWNWVRDLKYMSATVQGVAQQTRGPLLLANALVSRARAMVEPAGSVDKLLERVVESLAKTDITYERLAIGLDIQLTQLKPVNRKVAFDLRNALNRFRNALPTVDREALSLTVPDSTPALWGDPERLTFALRTTIGHLLAIRLPEALVNLTVADAPGCVSLRIELTASRSPAFADNTGSDDDPIGHAEAMALAAVGHALKPARVVIEGHGGQITAHDTRQGAILEISLPTVQP